MVLLSLQGLPVAQIAVLLECHPVVIPVDMPEIVPLSPLQRFIKHAQNSGEYDGVRGGGSATIWPHAYHAWCCRGDDRSHDGHRPGRLRDCGAPARRVGRRLERCGHDRSGGAQPGRGRGQGTCE